jgi:hypothetical protein
MRVALDTRVFMPLVFGGGGADRSKHEQRRHRCEGRSQLD